MRARTACALALGALVSSPRARAEEERVLSGGAELGAQSRLVWRGLALTAGPVASSAAWASVAGLTATTEADVRLDDEPRAPRLAAWTSAASYAWKWKRLVLAPGAAAYACADMRGTAEASLEASWTFGAIRAVTAQHVDVWRAPGAYFGTAGVEIVRESDEVTLRVFADVGWASAAFNQAYFGGRGAAIDVAEAGIATRVELGGPLFVAPHAETSVLLSPWLARAAAQLPVSIEGGAAVGLEVE